LRSYPPGQVRRKEKPRHYISRRHQPDLISYQILWYTSDMNKRITVKAHLNVEQVEARYRKAQDPVERSHWQIIWLVAQGKTTSEITEVTGYCANWIYTIVPRYNHEGPAGIGDRRHGNPGGTFILSAEQQ